MTQDISEHYFAHLKIEKIERTVTRGQATSQNGKGSRVIDEVTQLGIRADSIEELASKLRAHLAIIGRPGRAGHGRGRRGPHRLRPICRRDQGSSPPLPSLRSGSSRARHGVQQQLPLLRRCGADAQGPAVVNASTPLPAGSTIFVDFADPDDPLSGLEATLVKPNPDSDDDDYEPIAQSAFGGNVGEDLRAHRRSFLWAMSSLAAFHKLHFDNQSGVEY